MQNSTVPGDPDC